MSDVNIVKWPGANIYEDTTHRLVTDEQIERWDRIRELEDNEFWIELTPENIGEYTCTKEDPDGYWTDMGVADGTIFDSSSLDPGNYVIKLGLDKLVKMNSVSLPHIRVNPDLLPSGVLNGVETWDDYKLYTCYVNYGIEPSTLIFLCQFFGVEFSVDYLTNRLKNNYGISIKLQSTTSNISSTSSGESTTTMYLNDKDNQIYWPEYIKIKISKKEYGPADDQKYKLIRYIYADMNIVDYYYCANYKIDTDNIPDGEINEENVLLYNLPVVPLTDEDGNQTFIGEPFFHKYFIRETYVYVSNDISSKSARDYYRYYYWVYQNTALVPENVYDSIYLYAPNTFTSTGGEESGGVVYINGSSATFYSTVKSNHDIANRGNCVTIDGNSIRIDCLSNELVKTSTGAASRYRSTIMMRTNDPSSYGEQTVALDIDINDYTGTDINNSVKSTSNLFIRYNRDKQYLEMTGENTRIAGNLLSHYVKDGEDMNDLTDPGLFIIGDGTRNGLTDEIVVNNTPTDENGNNLTPCLTGGYVINNSWTCTQVVYDIYMNQYMRIAYSEPTGLAANEYQFIWGEWNRIKYSNTQIPLDDNGDEYYHCKVTES